MLLRMLYGYLDIFSDMLKKAKNVETESSLKELQESVRELKNKYKKEQEVWKQLHEINAIKVRIFYLSNGFKATCSAFYCTMVSFSLK